MLLAKASREQDLPAAEMGRTAILTFRPDGGCDTKVAQSTTDLRLWLDEAEMLSHTCEQ